MMGAAKDLILRPISGKEADALVKRVHYSGKVVQNSQIHIGVFYRGKLEGAMQFGPSLDKRKLIGLVSGTQWNEFIELNRMAFTDALPRNSESRALAVAFKLLRQHAPQLKWVVTFADATQCGDGTIYRAAGFVLTAVKVNQQLYTLPFADQLDAAPLLAAGLSDKDVQTLRAWLNEISPLYRQAVDHRLTIQGSLPDGQLVVHKLTVEDRPPVVRKLAIESPVEFFVPQGKERDLVVHKIALEGAPRAHKMSIEGGHRPSMLLSEVKNIMRRVTNGATSADRLFSLMGGRPTEGHQLRYIYFLDPSCRARLTVPELPYSEIERRGAGMYRGQKRIGGTGETDSAAQPNAQIGGASPTVPLYEAANNGG